MKKVASIVAAALVTCSLTACGNRNAAFRTPGTNQGGTNLSMGQGNNNVGVGNVVYKDGVYLGTGNRSEVGNNQAAIVTVSGGRVANVVLKTLDAQGKEIYTGNTTGGNNTTGRTTVGNTIGGTTANGTTTIPGNTTGSSTGGLTGNRYNTGTYGRVPSGAISGRDTARSIVEGTTPGGTNRRLPGGTAPGGITSGAITGSGNAGGTSNGIASTNLEAARRNLANAVVSQQTHNVNINEAASDRKTVDNWKLAISRALDTARR